MFGRRRRRYGGGRRVVALRNSALPSLGDPSICPGLFNCCSLLLHRLLEPLLGLVLSHDALRLREVQRRSHVGRFIVVLAKLPLRYPALAPAAPPAIADRDPEPSGRPPGHEPNYRSKGRIGKLYVRELLYRHLAAHRGRYELDHLYRLFTDYVGAEDA